MRRNSESDKSVTLTLGLLDTAISARALIGLHFSTTEGAAALNTETKWQNNSNINHRNIWSNCWYHQRITANLLVHLLDLVSLHFRAATNTHYKAFICNLLVVSVIFQAKMLNLCMFFLKCEDLLLFFMTVNKDTLCFFCPPNCPQLNLLMSLWTLGNCEEHFHNLLAFLRIKDQS